MDLALSCKQLASNCREHLWTRRLRKAIQQGDAVRAKECLTQGARVNGWKCTSPIFFVGIHDGGTTFKGHGALEMAFYWWATPEMFALLLAYGATSAAFDARVEALSKHAEFLDTIGNDDVYTQWVAQNGEKIEILCDLARSTQMQLDEEEFEVA